MASSAPHSDGDASRLSPPGYLSKAEAAERLGISTKTLDRRRSKEPLLKANELRKGNQVFFPHAAIAEFFELCQKRGHI